MRLPVPAVAGVLIMLLCSTPRAELYHLWSHAYGDTLIQIVSGVAVDTDGGIVVAGSFLKAIDFGGVPLVSAGGIDVFIARFDAGMQHVWSRRFGNAQSQLCNAMALAPNGDLVVVGNFGGAIDFGGGPLVSADGDDIFVARFERTGALVWAKGFPRAQSQTANDVAVDGDGNVFMTGEFWGSIDFGGGLLSSSGGPDAFLVEFSPAGGHLWSKRFGDGNSQVGDRLATDAAGSVVLAGQFHGSIDLGGGVLTSAGQDDMFLARWDAAGGADWSRRFGSTGNDLLADVGCAPDGTIALSGLSGGIDLGGGVTMEPGSFLAVFGADGANRWNVVPPGADGIAGFGSIEFMKDALVTAGSLLGSVTLAGRPFVSAGQSDLLVLAFDLDGNLVEAMARGSVRYESAQAAAATPNGEIVVAGVFNGDSNLGGGPLLHAGDGSMDIFVAAYSPVDPDYTPIAGFSAFLRGAVVEVRWQLATDDPADTCRLQRRTEPAGNWTTILEGSADSSPRAYDDASVAGGRTYAYQLRVESGEIEYASPVATVPIPEIDLSLLQNAPNPFAGTTTIRYSTTRDGPVTILIVDATGRRVARLIEGFRARGPHAASWDGRDESGRPAASGVYFYRIEGLADAGARKMLLLR